MGRKNMGKKKTSAFSKDGSGSSRPEGYRLALKYLQQNDLAAAEAQCRRVLAAFPGDAGVLQLAGLVARQQGDYRKAAVFFSEGIAATPDNPFLHEHLGRVYLLEERFEEAEASFRKALALKPDGASFHARLGDSLQGQEKHPDAVIAYEKAVDLDGKNAGALCGLGNTLRLMGRIALAVEKLEKAVRLHPDMAEAHNNFALTLQDKGELDQALVHYERAVSLAPGNALMHFNLARFYDNMGRHRDAEEGYTRSIKLDPSWIKPRLNLGTVYRRQGKVTKAISCFEALLEGDPDFTPVLHNLGNVYSDRGDTEKALNCFNRVLALNPDLPNTRSSWLLTRHYCSIEAPATFLEAHQEWERVHCRGIDPHGFAFPNSRDPDRPLRVGYVSPDFHKHSVGYFMAPVFSAHKRRQVEVYAYSDNIYRDEATRRMKAHVAQWHSVSGMSDKDLCCLIHGHGIDILVDLAGHTAHNRLPVFARKPAPVQVTYLGYPDTTGLSTIDYRITDAVADPPGSDAFCTETLIRLPNGFLCYQPPPDAPPVTARSSDTVVFGSFNNSAKLSLETIALWAEILRRIPGARLCIKSAVFGDDGARKRVLDLFQANGVLPDRITLWTRTDSTAGHLALYNEIDIALDTTPYNGTTTTCEALWMGTPVVTMNGNIHASRVGASLLHRVGLTDLVARDAGEYVEKVVALAGDRERLRRLHAGLREQMASSPLMDANAFVSDLEAAYRQMWRKWCEGCGKGFPDGICSDDDLVLAGERLFEQGDAEGARQAFVKALAADPANITAHNNLGVLYWQMEDPGNAIRLLEKVLSLKPGDETALQNIDAIRQHFQEPETTFSAEKKADVLFRLGNIYLSSNKFEAAADCFNRTIQIDPEMVAAWHNMGIALAGCGRATEALDCYKKAVELNPGGAPSFNSMGILLKECGGMTEALACFRQAVDVQPDYANAWVNLGNVYLEMSEPDSAEYAFGRALELSPDLPEVHFNLANLYSDRGDSRKAIAGYRKALQLKPDYPAAVAQLYYQARQVCDWPLSEQWGPKLDAHTESFLDAGRRPEEMPFINLTRRMDPGRNLAVACAWSRDISRRMPRGKPSFSHEGKKKRNDRIVVGYLSRDFRNHPVGLLTARMFACHDRNRFRVYGYAYGPGDSGEVRKKITDGCDRFANLGKLSTTASAQKIFEDDVDILVDLTGHTRGNRIDICALRPAPIQVSYLGFLGSSGAEFIDYILTDRMVTPPDQADAYSEKFVYLPDSFMVTDDRQPISEQLYERRDFGLPEKGFVFCSFNNAYKIDPAVFESWMRILKKIPGSVLWLFAKNSLTVKNLKREAANRGVSPDRLVFANKVPLEKHLARLKLADLALDTWSYNGGATTINALWTGVPVLTLAGSHFVSRMTASSLFAVGLKDLVTGTASDYEHLAARLACRPEALDALRARLGKNRSTAPLFDTTRFTRHLEMAYSAMWEKFAAGEAPGPIAVEALPRAVR